MKKSMLTVVMTVLLAVGFAASAVSAATTCTVESVEGEKVVLNCGKDATDFETGADVKVKAEKKKAVEGC